MKSVAVSEFKTHALRTVSRVASSRDPLIITKRGKPLVQVVPYLPPSATLVAGRLSEALVFAHDIVSPLGTGMWEASR